MSYLREYDFREDEDLLVERFYDDQRDTRPSFLFRLNVRTMDVHITVLRHFSSLVVSTELMKLYDLLELPYWKSLVRTCSVQHHYRQDDLFATKGGA